MKAWQADSLTGLDALQLREIPDPSSGPGEVVLQVHFAALNPADRYLLEKQYPARPRLPHVVGRDGIGKVVQVGPGVSNARIGDVRAILRGEVGVNLPGTLAGKVVVPADSLVEIPSGWTEQQTAAAPLVYLTALQALTLWGDLGPGVVLITGATGGVGVASVHLARALGHTVIGLSRDPEKQEKLKALGVAHTFDPNDPGWPKAALGQLAGKRVDLAIDNIGGTLFPQVIETMAEHGRISIVGRLAGPVPQFNTASLLFRRLRIGGVQVGSYDAASGQAAWKQIVDLMGQSGSKPLVDEVFPFEKVLDAFARLQHGPMGKVLVAGPRE